MGELLSCDRALFLFRLVNPFLRNAKRKHNFSERPHESKQARATLKIGLIVSYRAVYSIGTVLKDVSPKLCQGAHCVPSAVVMDQPYITFVKVEKKKVKGLFVPEGRSFAKSNANLSVY